MLDTIERFRSGLLRFAAAQGAAGKYHETITIAFMLLVCERTAEAVDQSWDQFATRNPDLLAWNPSILDRYYRADTLASDHARASFVCPDCEEGCLTGASEPAHGISPEGGAARLIRGFVEPLIGRQLARTWVREECLAACQHTQPI